MSGGATARSSMPSCSSTGGMTLLAGPPNLDRPPTRLLVEAAVECPKVRSPNPGVVYVCDDEG